MERIIENESLRVTIDDMGAELVSIVNKDSGEEYMWDANPDIWNRHAPILFPNVGKNYQNEYRVNGEIYTSKQHGFSRDMIFECVEADENTLVHVLCANDETKAQYPGEFKLVVTHQLNGRELSIQWQVTNEGEDDMSFTIGGHPAFVLPQGIDAGYMLEFNKQDVLTYVLIHPDYGTALTDVVYTLPLEENRVRLDRHMFDKDALIFDDSQIEKVTLCNPDGSKRLMMDCKGFPNFGIWSKPGADYVCLEPWQGRCDNTGFEDELSEKPGITNLVPQAGLEKMYTITIY